MRLLSTADKESHTTIDGQWMELCPRHIQYNTVYIQISIELHAIALEMSHLIIVVLKPWFYLGSTNMAC